MFKIENVATVKKTLLTLYFFFRTLKDHRIFKLIATSSQNSFSSPASPSITYISTLKSLNLLKIYFKIECHTKVYNSYVYDKSPIKNLFQSRIAVFMKYY